MSRKSVREGNHENESNSTVQVRDVILPDDLADVRKLWLEYLIWGNEKMKSLYGVHPHNPQEAVEQDILSIDKFLPPYGRLRLAIHEGKVCGLGRLKRINQEVGELKRMYVDPTFRGIGAGRTLLENLLLAAKNAGYKSVRLDSVKFMDKAHSLYRSFGFRDIDPYPEMEIPEEFIEYMVFMELDLMGSTK